jgi:hypothetical protein
MVGVSEMHWKVVLDEIYGWRTKYCGTKRYVEYKAYLRPTNEHC